MKRAIPIAIALIGVMTSVTAGAQEPVRLYAAGSLRAAMEEIAAQFAHATGISVKGEYGASGTLRDRIAGGANAEVFASANMAHPESLTNVAGASQVVLFTRNRLCALTGPHVSISGATMLERLLDPTVKLGTSTPKADPSGDYAWQLFAKAERLRPGSTKVLEGKAMQLVGGPDSPAVPAGRSAYTHWVDVGKVDVFLTYCTNAMLARNEQPSLRMVDVPEALAVGADYGLTVLKGARVEAFRFALYVMSAPAQALLQRRGFTPVNLPQ